MRNNVARWDPRAANSIVECRAYQLSRPKGIDNQTVVRLNRDTLYSSAVLDLDAGPVTITLPDAGKRFMSMQVTSEFPEAQPAS